MDFRSVRLALARRLERSADRLDRRLADLGIAAIMSARGIGMVIVVCVIIAASSIVVAAVMAYIVCARLLARWIYRVP